METVKIITDSACDLPADRLEKYDVEVLPLLVSQGETFYRDGIDIHPDKIYKDMANGVVYKTAQIPYVDYENCFTKYAKAGRQALYLCFSSGLSSTYQTAVLAAKAVKEKYPDSDVRVIDTKAVTGGLGMIADVVAPKAQEGLSMDDLIKLTKRCTAHIHHIFTVTNLEYVCRGGRISRASAFLGNVLKIHPFMIVDREGKLEITEKCRGEKKLLQRFISYIGEHTYDPAHQRIYFVDAVQQPLVDKLQAMITEKFGNTNFEQKTLAPVIGTHLGPGSMTVFFYDEDPQKPL